MLNEHNQISRFHWIILLLTILSGAALRLFHITELPLTNDELSALIRTQYDSLRHLIKEGVMEQDVHPAGLQLFLYYWTSWFGDAEAIIRLPFILMSLASIGLSFYIARLWFGTFPALLVATALASLQYPVFYGQIVRPYASGMFFCMALTICWDHFIFKRYNQYKYLWFSGWVLFSIFAVYNHYFSHLFALICGLTGLIYIDKSRLKAYLSGAFLVLIAYIPHLPVLFYHLDKGGLGGNGWLGPPGLTFIPKYAAYIFHFSPILITVVILILIYAAVLFYRKKLSLFTKEHVIAAMLFFIPFLTIYLYSHLVSPVMQLKSPVFGLPFLLMLIFSLCRSVSSYYQQAIVWILLLFTSVTTLIYERKHYTLMEKQPFIRFVEFSYPYFNEAGGSALAIFDKEPAYIQHYMKRTGKHFPFLSNYGNRMSKEELKKAIDTSSASCIISGGMNQDLLPYIRTYYPCFHQKEHGFTYDLYSYCQDPCNSTGDEEVLYTFSMHEYDRDRDLWTLHGNWQAKTGGPWWFEAGSDIDQPVVFNIPHRDYLLPLNTVIEVSLTAKSMDPYSSEGYQLILDISKQGRSQFSKTIDAGQSYESGNRWQTISAFVRMQDLFRFERQIRHSDLQLIFQTRGESNIRIGDIQVRYREGNPFLYGLEQPVIFN